MTMRAYAAAKRTLSFADKLLEVNWGLVLLIAIIATAGFAMLLHIPNGGMFDGRICEIVAPAIAPRIIGAAGSGVAMKTDGMRPIEHCKVVPVVSG